VPYADQQR